MTTVVVGKGRSVSTTAWGEPRQASPCNPAADSGKFGMKHLLFMKKVVPSRLQSLPFCAPLLQQKCELVHASRIGKPPLDEDQVSHIV